MSLVREKYGVQGNFLTTPGKLGSTVWQAILKARDVLMDGFSFKLGSGSSSLWYDEWLGNFKLCDLVPVVDIHDLQLTVRDVVHEGTWNFSRLYTGLPGDIVGLIHGRDCLLNERVPDCMVWN